MSIQKLFSVFTCLIVFITIGQSQESQIIVDNNYFFPGVDVYEQNELFGLALKDAERKKYIDPNIKDQAFNSYNLDESRSIDLMLEHALRSQDKFQKAEAYLAIADKYFQLQDYNSSKDYYEQVNPFKLNIDQRHEMQFKLAYCYLVNKDFASADEYFSNVSASTHELSKHARYYEGICAFYLGDRERALQAFKEVESYSKYRTMVPFYLAQIYFREAAYDEAIKYAKAKSLNASVDNYLLERILGLSYWAKNDYKNALIHLENYAENSPTISENDAFQLGRIHYELGNFDEAKSYFKELSYQDSEMGQMSNFLLASTSIEQGEYKDAQSAFKQAAKLNYYPDIKNESEFLYLKTSAQLGDERIAINGLANITANHPYYSESQTLLSRLLYNSKDTENAIQVIEALDVKSSEIKETYSVLNYYDGLQKLEDNAYEKSINSFSKAIEAKIDPKHIPDINYRIAYAHDKLGNISESETYMKAYLGTGDAQHRFESEYLLAYQKMELKSYDAAITHLENSIGEFNVETDDKNLFDDAVVRLADLELVKNNYDAALEYYELAIANKAQDADYILYQKSMIYGVNNQTIEKLTSLEKLLKSYPESKYRDDALFQLGETLVQLGKNNQAYQIYNSIIIEYGDKSPFSSIAYMRQGLISFNQGDLYAALDAYKQGVDSSKDKDERRRALMAIEDIYLYHLNDPDAFFKYSESLSGIQYDNITKDSIVYNIALNVYKDANYLKAIDQFKEYISRYPSGFYITDANYYLAESYLVQDQFDNALNYYQNVLKDQNNKFALDANKKAAVIAFNHAQDFDLSYQLYERLINSQSGTPEYVSLESIIYASFKTKRHNSVLKYGELLLSHNDAVPSSRASTHYYMAKAFMALQKPEEALTEFQSVTELSSNNMAAESSYMVSEIYYKSGQMDKAETQAFKTAETASNYPSWVAKSIMLLAEIYTQRKDYINATAAYESVIENFEKELTIVEKAKEKLKQLELQIESESRIVNENPDSEMQFIEADSTKVEKP